MTITANPQYEELFAKLNDPEELKRISNAGQLPEMMKHLMEEKSKTIKEEQQYIKDQVDLGIKAFMKEGVQRPDVSNGKSAGTARASRMEIAKGRGAIYNHKSPGAAIDNTEHKPVDMAEFLQGIWHHARALPNSDELETKARAWKKIQNSFGSTVPADGGFLMPEELRSDLLQLAMEDTIVRSHAQVIPMSSLALPIPTVDETSR